MTQNLRILAIARGAPVMIVINGQRVMAREGETVLAALLAAGVRTFKLSRTDREARGCLCGMGVCYECLVTINGQPNQRACMTEVQPQMEIDTL